MPDASVVRCARRIVSKNTAIDATIGKTRIAKWAIGLAVAIAGARFPTLNSPRGGREQKTNYHAYGERRAV